MTEEEKIFNQIREKFKREGVIDRFDMQKLEDALQKVKLSTQEDYEFIDDVTDFIIEQASNLSRESFNNGKDEEGRLIEKPYYQSAYNILNSCSKRFNSEYHNIFAIKTYYVRVEALKEGLEINLKRVGTSLDTFAVLKSNYNFAQSQLKMIQKVGSEDMIFRTEWLMGEINAGIQLLERRNAMIEGTLEENDRVEHRDDSGSGDAVVGGTIVTETVMEESVVEESVVEEEPVTGDGKNGDGEMAKKSGKGIVELSLEDIAEQLEKLDGDLVNPLNDSYTHLQILLKIIALQYKKIRILDQKIAKRREELEKLQIIFGDELSLEGIELVSNGANLTQKKANISDELESMSEDRLTVLSAFEENKKSAEKVIEELDREE